jgi:hypothetical protein
MRTLIITALLLVHGVAFAQSANQPAVSYSFGEFRYIDIDNGGDGFELGGSFQFNANWFGVASISSLDFNSNVDATNFEIGAGYIFPLQEDWDIQVNARMIRTEVDTPVGSVDDTGIGVLGGVRGLIAPQFEVRGNVHYINVDDSDVFLEIAGDWYFTPQFAAGLSGHVTSSSKEPNPAERIAGAGAQRSAPRPDHSHRLS